MFLGRLYKRNVVAFKVYSRFFVKSPIWNSQVFLLSLYTHTLMCLETCHGQRRTMLAVTTVCGPRSTWGWVGHEYFSSFSARSHWPLTGPLVTAPTMLARSHWPLTGPLVIAPTMMALGWLCIFRLLVFSATPFGAHWVFPVCASPTGDITSGVFENWQSRFVCSTAFFESIVGLHDRISCIIYCVPSVVAQSVWTLRLFGSAAYGSFLDYLVLRFVFHVTRRVAFSALVIFTGDLPSRLPSCLCYLFKRLKVPSNRFISSPKPSGHPRVAEDALI